MSEARKRPALDLTGFGPAPAPTEPIEATAIVAAHETGFVSRPPALPPTPDTLRPLASAPSTKSVRIAFDVPESLRRELQDGARMNNLGTVRAVILDALKAKGYAISDGEIIDKRTRR